MTSTENSRHAYKNSLKMQHTHAHDAALVSCRLHRMHLDQCNAISVMHTGKTKCMCIYIGKNIKYTLLNIEYQ